MGQKMAPFIVRLITCQMLTDFQNSFTVGIRRKFVMKLSLQIPPHLKCVTTLPREMTDDALKPATPLTNGAINQTLRHCPTQRQWLFLAGWLSWIVNIDRPSVEGHPEQHNQLNLSLGWGPHGRLDQRWSRNRSVASPAWMRHLTLEVWWDL